MPKITLSLLTIFALSMFSLTADLRAESPPTPEEEDIIIGTAYAFATMPKAKTGAAFLKLSNPTDTSDSLVEAYSMMAEFVELHQNYIDPDDDTMMMRKVKKIDIEANGHTYLEPTGYHIMLINLHQPLEEGHSFPLRLTFESGLVHEIDVFIVEPGSKLDLDEVLDFEEVHMKFEEEHGHDHVEPPKLMDFSDVYLKIETP